ncbi:unnamed protein product [Polarella glacialis]|uniref:Pathogen-related protein n=2 Tax=Polarella glacialis TaxID=89957 RepID=A0A813I9S2_POLGL|nr:unnamed protein product [Polarella glacialis]CAE8647086.1 unnamed protein product [Polarella glacialis]|mmetsp:Transcript_62725/g.101592  ORF Transcript_62725/g.101592 Transcript_62725/m.101592 type:complete len:247 (-) Transcript_62725:341-1081(-)
MAKAAEVLDDKGPLSDESKGLLAPYSELIRDYEPLPDARWRFGKPNYAKVNACYFQNRSKMHKEGSLEAVVNKLVKNWQVESHNIADIHHWHTMDISKFKAALNGGCPCSARLLADIGHNNMLLGETQDYTSKDNTIESSQSNFMAAMPEGFAWEVLEVFSGPPTVTFKWRHFGKFVGSFQDKTGKAHKGDGKMVDLIGICIAKVNAELKIETLDVYYNPDDMIKPLLSNIKEAKEEQAASGCNLM